MILPILAAEAVAAGITGSFTLGMAGLEPVVITHPLSSLTDEEIAQRIDQALPKIESVWLGTAR